MSEILFRNAELFTGERFLGPHDLLVTDSIISDITSAGLLAAPAAREIDLAGKWLLPAMCDLHVHLREPGHPQKETIATGLAAAASGGFGALVSMPNTDPPCDCREVFQQQLELREAAARKCERPLPVLLPACALTVGRRGSKSVVFQPLLDAGCVLFTDDGDDGQEEDDSGEGEKHVH